MPISNIAFNASITREFLATTDTLVGKKKQTIVAVGNGVLTKTSILLTRGSNLIGVGDTRATFVTGIVASPIQNLSNFSNGLKRFQVRRAGLGETSIEFAALSRRDVRTRVQTVATLQTFRIDKQIPPPSPGPGLPSPPVVLTPGKAFQCFGNDGAVVGTNSITYQLPNAVQANIGLEFFFAVDRVNVGGTVTIQRNRQRDVIQIRDSMVMDRSVSLAEQPLKSKGVILESTAKRVESISGTNSTGNKSRMSVVLTCREVGVWVAESVPDNPVNIPGPTPPARPDFAKYESLWVPGPVVEP